MAARLPLPAPRDELLDAVRELTAEVRELRAAVAPDLAERAAVLAALAGEFGKVAFTALDALEVAAGKPQGECARALLPLTGAPAGGVRRLAKRLAKMAGKSAGGFRLVRIGDDRGSNLYVTETA
jgi:hypothetical protein